MQDQLMQERTDLRNKLDNLPYEWEDAKRELLRLKMVESAAENDLEAADQALINANGGMKGLGSNDTERKASLIALRGISASFQAARKMLIAAQIDRQAQEVTVERLEKTLSAVGYQSRLLAGLLAYLGSAGVPVMLPEGEEVALNGFGI